jgi:hypothetical protein
MCAAVLVFEGLVVFFAMLVALDLSDVDNATLWWSAARRWSPASCSRACCAAAGRSRPGRCCRY